MNEICRTCLQEITNSSLIFCLDNADTKLPPVTIRSKLTLCVPELDLNLVPNAVICGSCYESLNSAHEFKNKCLEAEARIQNYIRHEGYISACVDLKRVVQHKEEPPPPFYKDLSSYLGGASRKSAQETSVKPLDITNLQCNTQELFAVPKIAQLLAGDSLGSSFKCAHCGYIATNDITLRTHEKTHWKYQHRCSECDYTAPKKQTLIIHMRKHAREKSFRCNVCSYGTPYRNLLVQHLRTQHMGERPYKCGTCEFHSIHLNALNKHVKTTHSAANKGEADLEAAVKSCDQKERLIHVKTTTAKKPYKCLLCEYSTSHKTNLGHHMRVHTDTEKLYKCRTCNYKATSKAHLRKHFKLQHGDEQVTTKCNQCESCIKRHEEEQQPYSCTFCNYKTATDVNLIKHLATHSNLGCGNHAKETSTCVICQKTFEDVESLKGHVKFHEGEANSIRDDRDSDRVLVSLMTEGTKSSAAD